MKETRNVRYQRIYFFFIAWLISYSQESINCSHCCCNLMFNFFRFCWNCICCLLGEEEKETTTTIFCLSFHFHPHSHHQTFWKEIWRLLCKQHFSNGTNSKCSTDERNLRIEENGITFLDESDLWQEIDSIWWDAWSLFLFFPIFPIFPFLFPLFHDHSQFFSGWEKSNNTIYSSKFKRKWIFTNWSEFVHERNQWSSTIFIWAKKLFAFSFSTKLFTFSFFPTLNWMNWIELKWIDSFPQIQRNQRNHIHIENDVYCKTHNWNCDFMSRSWILCDSIDCRVRSILLSLIWWHQDWQSDWKGSVWNF